MTNKFNLDSIKPRREYKGGGWLKDKLYNFLSNTGGTNSINGGKYTGSYIYGNNPDTIPGIVFTDITQYGGANADTTRNPLALYLGLDTIGLNKLRHDKYILDNDTVDVDVFDGKLLPIKKDKSPYKLHKSKKEEFDKLIEQNKTFLINTNRYPIDKIYDKQTLDNARHVRVKPIKNKDGSYSMKLTKLWDLKNSIQGGNVTDWINSKIGGKPFVLEQIMPVTFTEDYTSENYHINRAKELVERKDNFKLGGSIHIKPSHRGRLTELKARTGKSEAELYNDGNPAHKKMVVFARNARKWNK